MTPDFFITPTDTLLFELPSDMMVCLGLIEPSFPTSKIHGRLIYQVGYDVQNMNVEILVPDGIDSADIYRAFESVCERHVLLQGGRCGRVSFRVDGSSRRMSLRELVKNMRYYLTGHGAPVVRVHKFLQPHEKS